MGVGRAAGTGVSHVPLALTFPVHRHSAIGRSSAPASTFPRGALDYSALHNSGRIWAMSAASRASLALAQRGP